MASTFKEIFYLRVECVVTTFTFDFVGTIPSELDDLAA